MAYEVLARKWRPRQFADVIGQDHVIQTLKNAIKTKRVAHSYLFVGPRGIGKTSIARIFAKALNCEKGPTETPCDRCSVCTEIAAGNNLDVQEIDGASNRGIDEIRVLRETVQYMPAGRYRIFIIDEVHMLTTEAFNALLKTLEEPPPHIKFFLATTEPQKIPLTILSRCQRFDLRRIPVKLIMDRLALIAKSEKVSIDDDAILAISRAAEGSLRDAESSLDQLISFQGKKIHECDVLAIFGLISRKAMEDLVSALLKGDIVTVMRLIEDFDKQGKDMQRLLVELLEHCRNLLIYIQVGKGIADLDLEGSLIDVLKIQAELTNVDRLLKITEILMETMDRLRYALSKRTLLETAMIRCARTSIMVSLDDILVQVKNLKNSILRETGMEADLSHAEESSGSSKARHDSTLFSDLSAGPDHDSALGPKGHSESENRLSKTEKPALESKVNDEKDTPRKDELSHLKKEWHTIVERMGKVAILAKNCLMDAEPIEVNGDQVIIGFADEFSSRIEQMKLSRNRNALQKILCEILHRTVFVDFRVVDDQPREMMPKQEEPKVADPGTLDAKAEKKSSHSKKELLSNDAVKKTMDMFNCTIVNIKE